MDVKLGFSHEGKKHRLRVLKNRMLRRIFGPKREKLEDAGKDCIMRGVMTCTLQQMLLG